MSEPVANNRRSKGKTWTIVLIFLLLIALAGVLLLFFFERSGSVELDIGGQSVKVKLEEVPGYENEVERKIDQFEKQKSTLEKLLEERKINRELRDSISTLLYERQKDINNGKYLLQQFQEFKRMNSQQRETFLTEVYIFLSDDSNPDVNIDFGLVAESLIKDDRINELEKENDNLNQQVIELTKKINDLSNTVLKLREEARNLKIATNLKNEEINRLNKLFKEAQAKISELTNTPVDTSKYITNINELLVKIDKLESDSQYLQDSLKVMKNKFGTIKDVRIDNPIFEPLNAKKKRKGFYVLRQVNEIKFEFTFDFNYKINVDEEELLLVFYIPQSSSEYKKCEVRRNFRIGERSFVTLEKGKVLDSRSNPIKFEEGLYTVQVFHPETSETINILRKEFRVEKSLF